MAVRKDKVQIDISFLTDESKQYAKLIESNKQLVKDFYRAKKSGKDLTNVISKMAREAKKVEDVDLSKLAPSQLVQRAKQLSQVMRQIPTSAPQYKILSGELKRINDQLATTRAQTKGIAAGADKMRSGFGRFGKSLTGFVAGFGLIEIGRIVVNFTKEIFNLGTEMEVLTKKASTVFGEALPQVTAEAEKNATAMGLTTTEYIDAAAAMGDLLIPMKFTREEAAGISTSLVNLSGALSEWTGGQRSAEEVSKILSKALLGEREQLKELGISIQEADVKARLADKGLKGLTGEMLQQAKAAVTLELITEKTADAQAAYAENSGTLVRRQAELSAKFQDIKQTIAQVLIPVFTRLLEVAEPLITSFFNWIKAMVSGEKQTGKLSGVLNVMGVIVRNVWKVWGQFYGAVFKVGSYLADKLSPVLNFVGKLLVGFYNTVVTGVNKFNELLGFELRLEKIDLSEVDKQLKDEQDKLDKDPLTVKIKKQFDSGDLGIQSESGKTRLTDSQKAKLKKEAEAEEKIKSEARFRYLQNEYLAKQREIDKERYGYEEKQVKENNRRKIDEELNFLEDIQDVREDHLKNEFASRILSEQDYELQKLELKREYLSKEIDILRQGTDADIAEGYRKYLLLKELDDEITQTKIENAQREADVKRELQQIAIDTASNALSVGAELLAQDEKARKKHASAIKAFQAGQVIVSGVSEVQKIWEKSADFGPFGAVLAAIQTAVAIGRTTAAVGRIRSTKFARGGIFGGKPHSDGGTKGYFDDGTQIEVEADEMFAVINKRSTGLLQQLSAFNQLGGGVPLMQRGGVFAAGGVPDTSPANIDLNAYAAASGGANLAPILAEMSAMRVAFEQFPRTLKAKVVYGEYEDAASDISDVQNAANL